MGKREPKSWVDKKIETFFYEMLLFGGGSPENIKDKNGIYTKLGWPEINEKVTGNKEYKYRYDQMNPHEDHIIDALVDNLQLSGKQKKEIKKEKSIKFIKLAQKLSEQEKSDDYEDLIGKIEKYAKVRKTIGNIYPIIADKGNAHHPVNASKGSLEVSGCCDTFEGFVEFLNKKELQKPKKKGGYNYRKMATCYKNALINNREAWFMDVFINENGKLKRPLIKNIKNIEGWKSWLDSTTNRIESRTDSIIEELTKELKKELNGKTK